MKCTGCGYDDEQDHRDHTVKAGSIPIPFFELGSIAINNAPIGINYTQTRCSPLMVRKNCDPIIFGCPECGALKIDIHPPS